MSERPPHQSVDWKTSPNSDQTLAASTCACRSLVPGGTIESIFVQIQALPGRCLPNLGQNHLSDPVARLNLEWSLPTAGPIANIWTNLGQMASFDPNRANLAAAGASVSASGACRPTGAGRSPPHCSTYCGSPSAPLLRERAALLSTPHGFERCRHCSRDGRRGCLSATFALGPSIRPIFCGPNLASHPKSGERGARNTAPKSALEAWIWASFGRSSVPWALTFHEDAGSCGPLETRLPDETTHAWQRKSANCVL